MHEFVAEVRRELDLRRVQYSRQVKEGRLKPEIARRQYDRLEKLLKFLEACDRRYSAEAKYDPKNMKILEDMAEGDCEARSLWMSCERHGDEAREG
jgi:hypothetical protein